MWGSAVVVVSSGKCDGCCEHQGRKKSVDRSGEEGRDGGKQGGSERSTYPSNR